jgi:hypothetical protein
MRTDSRGGTFCPCLECPGERHRVRFATEEAPAIRAKRGAQHIGYPFRAGSPTVERIEGLAERVARTFCQRCRTEARSLDERVRAVANESFSWLSFHLWECSGVPVSDGKKSDPTYFSKSLPLHRLIAFMSLCFFFVLI